MNTTAPTSDPGSSLSARSKPSAQFDPGWSTNAGMYITIFAALQADGMVDEARPLLLARSVGSFGHFLAQRCPFQQGVERRA